MPLFTDKQIHKESESCHFPEYVQGYWDNLNFTANILNNYFQ